MRILSVFFRDRLTPERHSFTILLSVEKNAFACLHLSICMIDLEKDSFRFQQPKAICHGSWNGVSPETALPSMFEKETIMHHQKLLRLCFMALCCDFGLFTKQLIAPAVNIITDSLHIPGGIGTSFSLLFLVVAAAILPRFGSATVMGAVQSVIALSLGMVGSMGILSPIGYLVPGLVIDLVLWICRRASVSDALSLMLANMLAALSAGLTANVIVFTSAQFRSCSILRFRF